MPSPAISDHAVDRPGGPPGDAADDDVIDRAAGLVPGDPLHGARRFRAKVVEATQASHDALLEQPVDGLSTADRLRVAVHVCTIAGATTLALHYQARLVDRQRRDDDARLAADPPRSRDDVAAVDSPPPRHDAAANESPRAGDDAAAVDSRFAGTTGRDARSSAALPAMLRFAATLTTDPRSGDRAALESLRAAGLGDAAIVALAQLVAFLSYQLRVVAGLQALRASRTEVAP